MQRFQWLTLIGYLSVGPKCSHFVHAKKSNDFEIGSHMNSGTVITQCKIIKANFKQVGLSENVWLNKANIVWCQYFLSLHAYLSFGMSIQSDTCDSPRSRSAWKRTLRIGKKKKVPAIGGGKMRLNGANKFAAAWVIHRKRGASSIIVLNFPKGDIVTLAQLAAW